VNGSHLRSKAFHLAQRSFEFQVPEYFKDIKTINLFNFLQTKKIASFILGYFGHFEQNRIAIKSCSFTVEELALKYFVLKLLT
jgi:hypothetical protein